MADIQQWRRKIQPTKTRTPTTTSLDLEESDDLQPPTPKRRLKPKLSAYFIPTSKPITHVEDLSGSHLPKWPFAHVDADPRPEDGMDAIMCHLMAQPYLPLSVRFNASLMRVFESYAMLMNETACLKSRCNDEMATARAIVGKMHMAEKDWEEEKRDYKEEVKRLEVLLCKTSRRGVAEVTLARQESKIYARYSGGAQKKETIFEVLEKTTKRHENDTTWSSQRATMKPLLQSSSDQDITLSQRLSQKKSMTNIHPDLPFGTPPAKDMRFSLAKVSMPMDKQQAAIRRRKRPTHGSVTTYDTLSAFSCAGDLLPDESTTHAIHADGLGGEQDAADVETIANALAHRRGVAPSQVMPQLMELFAVNPSRPANRTCSAPDALGISVEQPSAGDRINASPGIVKRATVMTKASGFFHKLRPQLTIDPLAAPLAPFRRFSFEPDDDAFPHRFATSDLELSLNGNKELRRSTSLCSVSARTPSRIPTPVYTPGIVVRPRRERDESSSSLLTAIKRSQDGTSRTSSTYSSPSVLRDEFVKTTPCEDRVSMSGLSSRKTNRLLDYTNDPRGSSHRDGGANAKHFSARSILESCESLSDMSRPHQLENFHPAK